MKQFKCWLVETFQDSWLSWKSSFLLRLDRFFTLISFSEKICEVCPTLAKLNRFVAKQQKSVCLTSRQITDWKAKQKEGFHSEDVEIEKTFKLAVKLLRQ